MSCTIYAFYKYSQVTMTERNVVIYVTKELRNTIKTLKKELSYEHFISELVKKIPESSTQSMKKPSRSIKGTKLR